MVKLVSLFTLPCSFAFSKPVRYHEANDGGKNLSALTPRITKACTGIDNKNKPYTKACGKAFIALFMPPDPVKKPEAK